jgi:hypothetical protein
MAMCIPMWMMAAISTKVHGQIILLTNFRQSLGNVHRTEAGAEHYKNTTLRRWQAEIAIRRWRDEHCPFTPDWTDVTQQKWL